MAKLYKKELKERKQEAIHLNNLRILETQELERVRVLRRKQEKERIEKLRLERLRLEEEERLRLEQLERDQYKLIIEPKKRQSILLPFQPQTKRSSFKNAANLVKNANYVIREVKEVGEGVRARKRRMSQAMIAMMSRLQSFKVNSVDVSDTFSLEDPINSAPKSAERSNKNSIKIDENINNELSCLLSDEENVENSHMSLEDSRIVIQNSPTVAIGDLNIDESIFVNNILNSISYDELIGEGKELGFDDYLSDIVNDQIIEIDQTEELLEEKEIEKICKVNAIEILSKHQRTSIVQHLIGDSNKSVDQELVSPNPLISTHLKHFNSNITDIERDIINMDDDIDDNNNNVTDGKFILKALLDKSDSLSLSLSPYMSQNNSSNAKTNKIGTTDEKVDQTNISSPRSCNMNIKPSNTTTNNNNSNSIQQVVHKDRDLDREIDRVILIPTKPNTPRPTSTLTPTVLHHIDNPPEDILPIAAISNIKKELASNKPAKVIELENKQMNTNYTVAKPPAINKPNSPSTRTSIKTAKVMEFSNQMIDLTKSNIHHDDSNIERVITEIRPKSGVSRPNSAGVFFGNKDHSVVKTNTGIFYKLPLSVEIPKIEDISPLVVDHININIDNSNVKQYQDNPDIDGLYVHYMMGTSISTITNDDSTFLSHNNGHDIHEKPSLVEVNEVSSKSQFNSSMCDSISTIENGRAIKFFDGKNNEKTEANLNVFSNCSLSTVTYVINMAINNVVEIKFNEKKDIYKHNYLYDNNNVKYLFSLLLYLYLFN
jgi:hypothetical protein